MELNCNVIKDILPLYAEKLVSDDTKKLVQAHLAQCECCKGRLLKLKGETELSQTNAGGMKKIAGSIQKTRIWTAVSAVLLVISLAVSLMIYLSFPVWATAEEVIESVECLDDGSMKISFTDAYGGIVSTTRMGTCGILCQKVRMEILIPTKLPEGMNDASYESYMIMGNTRVNGEISEYARETDIWYLSYRDGTAQKLLWDAGMGSTAAAEIEMSKLLLRIFLSVLVLFAVTGSLGLMLRKRPAAKVLLALAAFFGSFCLSALVVTSGRFMVYEEFWYKFSTISILTAMISAAVLSWAHLRRLKSATGL